MVETVQKDAVGVVINWVTTEDISGATTLELRALKPNASTRETWTVTLPTTTTNITNDTAQYKTVSGDLDTAGDYEVYLYAFWDANNSFSTPIRKFRVKDTPF